MSSDNFSANTTDTINILKVDPVKELDDYLWIYFSPIIFILGICGNSLTLAVMSRKCLRGTTTSVYMPVMAVFDTIALTSGIIPEWSKACGFVPFRDLDPWTCRLEKFIFYTSSDIAIWILVLFTVDRFVAVCFPLQKRSICVPRRSKIACLCVFLCASIKNFHVFWTRGAEYNEKTGDLITKCGKPEPYKDFEQHIRPFLAFALISALPFCILLACNCQIIWALTKMKRSQQFQFQSQQLQNNSNHKGNAFRQTTMMCMSASFVFLICVIPSMVILIGKPYWSAEPNQSYDIAKAINNQLAYLNHSINFFLYCMTGQKFRSELIAMFREGKKRISMLDDYSPTSGTDFTRRRSGCDSTTITHALHDVNTRVIEPIAPNLKPSNCKQSHM